MITGIKRKNKRRGSQQIIEQLDPVISKGMEGGKYKPLTENDIKKIHSTALDVLQNLGVGNPLPELIEAALRQGCSVNENGRLCFPKSLVEDVISRAGRDFVLYGRDPKHDIDLSGNKVNLFGAGEAVSVLDLGASKYRPSTINDVYDVARMVDYLDNIHSYSRFVVPTELSEDLYVADINTAYASIAGTKKHTALTFSDCEVAVASLQLNAPIWVVIAPQSGATAPAALAGCLVQSLAETLASLLLIDLIKPGHPVIFGPWPFVTDLRTGAFSGGGGEEAIMSAASAQITNHYGLVSSVGAGMTDAKSPDAQAGYEKGISIVMAALAGCNNVSESSGMMASLMGCSYESLVIDNEMLGMVMRAVRGIEVNDDTLSYSEIEKTIQGEGHFLRSPQTLSLMKTEYLYPNLADRSRQEEWESEGSPDMRKRAENYARKILNTHYPVYIDEKTDQKIRDKFPIKISKDIIKPNSNRF